MYLIVLLLLAGIRTLTRTHAALACGWPELKMQQEEEGEKVAAWKNDDFLRDEKSKRERDDGKKDFSCHARGFSQFLEGYRITFLLFYKTCIFDDTY